MIKSTGFDIINYMIKNNENFVFDLRVLLLKFKSLYSSKRYKGYNIFFSLIKKA